MSTSTPTVKLPPPWSSRVNLMARILCKICGHLHPGGMFGRGNCKCCRHDYNENGWDGHA